MRFLNWLYILLAFPLPACGALTSTGSRYHTGRSTSENKPKEVKIRDTVYVKEDFDITPYMTKIEINDNIPEGKNAGKNNVNAWYDYDTTLSNSAVSIPIKQTAGYRVLVLTTDNLDEANKMKAEIYFKTDQKPVYISFDPPFYKVKAGDFVNSTEANALGFKLNQMGYSESKVIRDTVNIFQ
jgi:hypothetical protein